MRADRRQRGQALVLVVGVVALISAIAAAYLSIMSTETRRAAAMTARTELGSAADAASTLVHWGVLQGWRREDADQLPGVHFCSINDLRVRIEIINEGVKPNINLATAETIATALMRGGVGEARAISTAETLRDFIDRDNRAEGGGLEPVAYNAGAGKAPRPKDAPVDLMAELKLAPGVDDVVFTALAGEMTIYSGRAAVSSGDPETLSSNGWYRVIVEAQSPGGLRAARESVIALYADRPAAIDTYLWRTVESRGDIDRDVASLSACADYWTNR